MSSKGDKRRKAKKKHDSEITIGADRILRTLGNEQAFYFYEAIGKPTGESARSLSDFLGKARSVRLETLLFHLRRKDFQNWIEKTLGDQGLARKINRIPRLNNDDTRKKICRSIENRIRKLQASSISFLVNDPAATIEAPA
jgi:hypothetical protein